MGIVSCCQATPVVEAIVPVKRASFPDSVSHLSEPYHERVKPHSSLSSFSSIKNSHSSRASRASRSSRVLPILLDEENHRQTWRETEHLLKSYLGAIPLLGRMIAEYGYTESDRFQVALLHSDHEQTYLYSHVHPDTNVDGNVYVKSWHKTACSASLCQSWFEALIQDESYTSRIYSRRGSIPMCIPASHVDPHAADGSCSPVIACIAPCVRGDHVNLKVLIYLLKDGRMMAIAQAVDDNDRLSPTIYSTAFHPHANVLVSISPGETSLSFFSNRSASDSNSRSSLRHSTSTVSDHNVYVVRWISAVVNNPAHSATCSPGAAVTLCAWEWLLTCDDLHVPCNQLAKRTYGPRPHSIWRWSSLEWNPISVHIWDGRWLIVSECQPHNDRCYRTVWRETDTGRIVATRDHFRSWTLLSNGLLMGHSHPLTPNRGTSVIGIQLVVVEMSLACDSTLVFRQWTVDPRSHCFVLNSSSSYTNHPTSLSECLSECSAHFPPECFFTLDHVLNPRQCPPCVLVAVAGESTFAVWCPSMLHSRIHVLRLQRSCCNFAPTLHNLADLPSPVDLPAYSRIYVPPLELALLSVI